MKKLSVTIITLNEEKNIKRCLDSVLPIADEIVVVDSLSTDKTEAICKGYDNLRFVQQKWLGYSEQKNYANDMATYDWVFSIDADEVLSESLQQSILDWKKSDSASNECFSMNRLTNYCGHWIKHCGWYPDTKIRIWNKKVGKWTGTIHEVIDFSETMTTKKLRGDLLHYSYHSIEEHIRQADKFTSLTAQTAFDNGKHGGGIAILYIKAWWKFFHDYILKLGILDGYYGYVVCKISSYATMFKYAKLNELNKKNNEDAKSNNNK